MKIVAKKKLKMSAMRRKKCFSAQKCGRWAHKAQRSIPVSDYEVGQHFSDVYQHLAELDDEADWPRLM